MTAATTTAPMRIPEDDWQLWLVLRHLLPAQLQRKLAREAVQAGSQGAVSWDDLFEELNVDGPLWNEAWAIRPRSITGDLANAMQSWGRSFVWQSARQSHFSGLGNHQRGDGLMPSILDLTVGLGTLDLACPVEGVEAQVDQFQGQTQPSLRIFWHVLKTLKKKWKAAEPASFAEEIAQECGQLATPLRAMVMKHLADLLADADAWAHASCVYDIVGNTLDSWSPPDDLIDLVRAWKSITIQCRAHAAWCVEGKEAAASRLTAALARTTFDGLGVLASANLAVDALYSQGWFAPGVEDKRVSILASPLLHLSQDRSKALESWLSGKPEDAASPFWGLLRRQIALGAATAVRETKGWYARSILEDVSKRPNQEGRERLFAMAIRLLVEGERPKHVELIDWSESIVDRFVTDGRLIDEMVAHATAHEGCRLQRLGVLVEIFRVWGTKLTPSSDDLIIKIWKYLSTFAADHKETFDSDTDVGRLALKALRELARKRPELRRHVSREAGKAILARLAGNGDQTFWGQAEAAETASEYIDVMDEESLRVLAKMVLKILEDGDPARNEWPLNRPLMRILVHHGLRESVFADEVLGRQCVDQILRYGLVEDVLPATVFLYLADWDPEIFSNEVIRAKLDQPLRRVREGTRQLGSSDITDCLNALIIAPVIAGREGIGDALDGLVRILSSANTERHSVGITSLFQTLQLLTKQLPAIHKTLPTETEWLDAKISTVVDGLLGLWKAAAAKPLLFAPFAIPRPTEPNEVVVHNTAFATIVFGRAVNRETQLRAAVDSAAKSPSLRNAIRVVHATLATGRDFREEDSNVVQDEDRIAFYRALGRRLRQIAQQQPEQAEQAKRTCLALVANCLKLGPKPEDAALLISAANLGLHEKVRDLGLEDYTSRVEDDRTLSLLLLPILALFSVASDGN